jgi:hypothetical protein
MRDVLLVLIVLAVAVPALAGWEEQILQMSDDTRESAWGSDNKGSAQWFEAPAGGCYILSASFYCVNDGTKDVSVWDNDTSGTDDLPGTLLGSVSESFTPGSSWTWSDYVDLTDLGLTMSGGEKFWVGIDYSVGVNPLLGLDDDEPIHRFAYSWDGTSWSRSRFYDLMVRVKIDDDVDPPYVDGQDPTDGSWTQETGTDIVFHCKDDDKGVDSGTIDFSAAADTGADVSGLLDIDDSDPNDVVCTFTPDSDLPEAETITCTVAGILADGLGNEMGAGAVWSFGVDGTPLEPTPERLTPEPPKPERPTPEPPKPERPTPEPPKSDRPTPEPPKPER